MVGGDDRMHQSQSKPVAWSGPAGVAAEEPLEDVAEILRRDATSGIADLQADSGFQPLQPDRHPALRRRELECIVDQIGDHPLEFQPVAPHHNRPGFGKDQPEVDLTVLRQRQKEFMSPVEQQSKINLFEVEFLQ